MNNNIELPEIVVIKSGMTAIPESDSPYSMVPLIRTSHLFELAIQELDETERYSIRQLAEELQRQAQIITAKGGITTEQKLQLKSLMMACITDLRAVNAQLSNQLIEILFPYTEGEG